MLYLVTKKFKLKIENHFPLNEVMNCKYKTHPSEYADKYVIKIRKG